MRWTGDQRFFLFFLDHDVPLEVSKKSVMGEMTKDEIIAMVGWPKIGQDNRAQIRVKENKEFKVMLEIK